jgi:hypothetical protein
MNNFLQFADYSIFSVFSSNSGDSYTLRPLTVVNDTDERDWSPVVTDSVLNYRGKVSSKFEFTINQ